MSPKKFGWASIVKTDGTLESAILGINEALYEKKVRLCGFAGLVYEDAVDYRKRLAAAEAQEQEQAEEKGRKSKKNVTALATEPDEDAKRRLGAFVASTYCVPSIRIQPFVAESPRVLAGFSSVSQIGFSSCLREEGVSAPSSRSFCGP